MEPHVTTGAVGVGFSRGSNHKRHTVDRQDLQYSLPTTPKKEPSTNKSTLQHRHIQQHDIIDELQFI